jgi:hypothetical protein
MHRTNRAVAHPHHSDASKTGSVPVFPAKPGQTRFFRSGSGSFALTHEKPLPDYNELVIVGAWRAIWLEDPMQNLYGRAMVPLAGWVNLKSGTLARHKLLT